MTEETTNLQGVLIAALAAKGLPTSPYMQYWTLTEVTRYSTQHMGPTTSL